jgi:hypothetical protein
MQVYVEGELEVRVFNDADTGAVKRDHEVAVDATGLHYAPFFADPVCMNN